MKLIFVYNADSGLLSSMQDTVQTIVAPEQYDCNLRRLTYNPLTKTKRREWKQFIDGLDVPVEFLYKDEATRAYPGEQFHAPSAVHKRQGGFFTQIITPEEIAAMESLEQLMHLVRARLQ